MFPRNAAAAVAAAGDGDGSSSAGASEGRQGNTGPRAASSTRSPFVSRSEKGKVNWRSAKREKVAEGLVDSKESHGKQGREWDV